MLKSPFSSDVATKAICHFEMIVVSDMIMPCWSEAPIIQVSGAGRLLEPRRPCLAARGSPPGVISGDVRVALACCVGVCGDDDSGR